MADICGLRRIIIHLMTEQLILLTPEQNTGLPISSTQIIKKKFSIIDQWCVDRDIDRIAKGNSFKIIKRWISVLNTSSDTIGNLTDYKSKKEKSNDRAFSY